ncbi:DUF624 domain-containing protein [Clostridium sp. MB05]|jgi:uncharacterized membrane protein YesL|uniref:DUF624 domain-containing protein n=1 Tax=Clostridium sp. MB05 TaxID=3376682 RepID=UPI0039819C6E
MKGIFSYDGPIYKICELIYETCMLNILWIIGCIPIVTIGASTTALYSVYNSKISGKGYKIYSDFFKAYKKNIRQASILGTIITIMLCMGIYNMTRISSFKGNYVWLQYVHIFIIFQILLISNYIFSLIDRTTMNITDIIVNAVILAYKNIIISIINVVVLALLIALLLFKPVIMLFFMGIYGLISSYLIERVFEAIKVGISKEK